MSQWSIGFITQWSIGFILFQGTIVTCHYDGACPGGSDSPCGDGYGGPRCGLCADGYYKLSQRCRECASTAASLTLVILLAILTLCVIVFFLWQTLRDPRVGSPIVFLMKLLETLSIMSLTIVRWPGSVATFLPILSLVNFNTEMFQTECILGRPHPTRAALMYIGGLAAAVLIMLLFWPLLRLLKRSSFNPNHAENAADLESMCAQLRPDGGHDKAPMVHR